MCANHTRNLFFRPVNKYQLVHHQTWSYLLFLCPTVRVNITQFKKIKSYAVPPFLAIKAVTKSDQIYLLHSYCYFNMRSEKEK